MDDSRIIGVITPVYNGEEVIEKSILTLLNQTYQNWISIIVNDGSTDDTKEILDNYSHDSRFFIIHLPENRGRSVARQTALEKIMELKCKYMCMLDADDLYYPDKLQKQFDYMENHPDIVLSSTSIGISNGKSNITGVLKSSDSEKKFIFDKYEDYRPVPHASSIIRVCDIDVDYDVSMKYSEDQDFMRRLLLGKNYSFLPAITYIYNMEQSFSLSKYIKSLNAGLYSQKKMGMDDKNFFALKIINSVKIVFIKMLFFLNLSKVYFTIISTKPSDEETAKYHIFMKNLL